MRVSAFSLPKVGAVHANRLTKGGGTHLHIFVANIHCARNRNPASTFCGRGVTTNTLSGVAVVVAAAGKGLLLAPLYS